MLYRLYRVITVDEALCFYIESNRNIDQKSEMPILMRILQAVQNKKINHKDYIEVGYKLNFVTSWCRNTVQLLHQSGFSFINRIEKSHLYRKGFEYKFDPLLETVYPKDGLECLDDVKKINKYKVIDINKIRKYLKKQGLNEDNITYYKNIFKKIDRDPTDVELFGLFKCNNENPKYSFFNSNLIDIDGSEIKYTFFDLIKESFTRYKNSFYTIKWIRPIDSINISPYQKNNLLMHPSYTSYSTFFQSDISPFINSSKIIGSRIHDNQSIGKGGFITAGVTGYYVGDLKLEGFNCENLNKEKSKTAEKIKIEGSNGISDYANKIGEPVILGFTRSFGQFIIRMDNGEKERVEWTKPIMFSAGIGQIVDSCFSKKSFEVGNNIVIIGGSKHDNMSIKVGDPEMNNKINRVIRSCIELEDHNPIISIYNNSYKGIENITRNIFSEKDDIGVSVNLDRIFNNDSKDLWIDDYKEEVITVVDDDGLELLNKLGEREKVNIVSIGKINKSKKIIAKKNNKKVVDLPSDILINETPKKSHQMKKVWYKFKDNRFNFSLKRKDLLYEIEKVFSLLNVGSKRFLVNKVDRSCTGLIAQQQCVGFCQIPISNYSLVAQSYFGYTGVVTSVGEQPIKGLISPEIMSRLSVGEMLCNMMGCVISGFDDIKCNCNWTWSIDFEGEKYRMYNAVKSLSHILCKLGISINSTNENIQTPNIDTKFPGSLVLSGYCTVPDIRMKVDPGLKKSGNSLFLIDFGGWKCRMGGSSYLQSNNQLGKFVPDLEDADLLKNVFILVQKLITKKIVVSLHDRSDGGLITTLCEMAFANQLGVILDLEKYSKKCTECTSSVELLFNEELGVVIEVESAGKLINIFKKFGLEKCLVHLGYVSDNSVIDIKIGDKILVNEEISSLQMFWELLSFNLEKRQTSLECARDEYTTLGVRKLVDWNKEIVQHPIAKRRVQIAVIREEGCTGDKELSAMFYHAGFRPWDLCMSDLFKNEENINILDQFRGVILPGGFSYGSACGGGRGWASSILYNDNIKRIFDRFKEREDTFSLGVGDGFQLMCNIDWIPGKVRLVENQSGRFESRCVMVKVCNEKSILFKGMSGEVLNVWISHYEGQINVPVNDDSLAVLKYVDQKGDVTKKYPWNPNGSIGGVTGICDETGRHFGMMPHLERSFLNWQMPYGTGEGNYTGWFKCVLNAYKWCIEK